MEKQTFTKKEIIAEIIGHTAGKTYINETDSYEDGYTTKDLKTWSNNDLANEMISLCSWENEVEITIIN